MRVNLDEQQDLSDDRVYQRVRQKRGSDTPYPQENTCNEVTCRGNGTSAAKREYLRFVSRAIGYLRKLGVCSKCRQASHV